MHKSAVRRDSGRILAEFASRIGRTPMVYLSADIGDGTLRRIGIKLEGANPCGSIKDRTAYSLFSSVEPQRLDEASMLVESTSGNLGVAMSWLAKLMDLEFVAVVDPRLSPEIRQRLHRLGARLETVEHPDATGGYLLSRLQRVREIGAQEPEAIWLNQYGNAANPDVHHRTTGPEITRQTGGMVDAVFVAVSTGGTLAGIARHFREAASRTRVIGVDAVGSVVFVDRPGRRRLSGIGSSRRSDFLVADSYDDFVLVPDEVAFSYCRELRARSGLSVGGSSGAVLAGCLRYLAAHPEIRHPVCLAPDYGDNYQSTIYDDDYLRREAMSLEHSLLSAAPNLPPVRLAPDLDWRLWR